MMGASLLQISLADLRQTDGDQLLRPAAAVRAVAPMMRQQRFGRIVNVSSGYGALSEMGAGRAGLQHSKAALNA